MKRSLLMACVLVVVLSMVSQATLDQSQDLLSSAITVDGAATSLVSQVFTQGAGLNYLESIWVRDYVPEWDVFPWQVTLEVRNSGWTNPEALGLLYSQTYTVTSAPSDGWFKFDFSSLVPVTPEGWHTFILRGAGTGSAVLAIKTDADAYSGGWRAWTGTGGAPWNNYYAQDMTFRTYSVPEPVTLMLLAMGGVSAILRRRSV